MTAGENILRILVTAAVMAAYLTFIHPILPSLLGRQIGFAENFIGIVVVLVLSLLLTRFVVYLVKND